MSEYEAGKRAFEALASEFKDSARIRNEATTRFHVLDQVIEALGWPRAQTETERHHRGTYSDYELGAPPAILLEAKREGAQFDLPVDFPDTPRLRDLKEVSEDASEAVVQAMDYAQHRGIPLAVISNGHQLAAFVASRQDGVPPEQGRAIVFRSLSDMAKRFNELWEALSPGGVRLRHLEARLHARSGSPPPSKLSRSLVSYPGFKNRNPVAANLQILGGLFVEDIAREPAVETRFLSETYCRSGALSQYALVSKDILAARYSQSFESDAQVSAAPAVSKKGINSDLSVDMLAAALSRRPILLVGDVGAGKSMFVRHLIKVEAREELKKAIVLYVDFGSKPALAKELKPYVSSELQRQLLAEYSIDIEEKGFVHGAYHAELARFSKGIFGDLKERDPETYERKKLEKLADLLGDVDAHLRRSLEHIVNGWQRRLVLFLDNVDQRPAAFQEEVFLIAQSVAQHWPVTVFVSLRPETFAHSRVSGALSGYQPRVFTIDPPRIDQVLSKRLAFAIQILQETGSFPWLPEGFSFRSESLLSYMQVVNRALSSGGAIVEFVDNMSAGNMRKALDFVSAFVGSGHVDSQKILDIEETRSYTLPLHEFLRAVMFGDHVYYDPQKSPIPNVLDVSTADGREHFLVSLLISFAEVMGAASGRRGYVEFVDVSSALQQLGYHPTQIDHALAAALESQLVATPSGTLSGEQVRVTSRGAYAIKRLLKLFTYVDAMIVDTPILEPETRAKMRDVQTIGERIDRCRVFADYLDRQWAPLSVPDSCPFLWPQIGAELREDIERAERGATRRG